MILTNSNVDKSNGRTFIATKLFFIVSLQKHNFVLSSCENHCSLNDTDKADKKIDIE